MLRDDQIKRYSRHVLLPDVGGVGQKRILAATVEIRDAGATGAAAIVYLAAAGVGTLMIGDQGLVLAEDVGALYETGDIGRLRAEAAAERVAALNPDVCVVAADVDVDDDHDDDHDHVHVHVHDPDRQRSRSRGRSRGRERGRDPLPLTLPPVTTTDPIDSLSAGATAAALVLRAIVSPPGDAP